MTARRGRPDRARLSAATCPYRCRAVRRGGSGLQLRACRKPGCGPQCVCDTSFSRHGWACTSKQSVQGGTARRPLKQPHASFCVRRCDTVVSRLVKEAGNCLGSLCRLDHVARSGGLVPHRRILGHGSRAPEGDRLGNLRSSGGVARGDHRIIGRQAVALAVALRVQSLNPDHPVRPNTFRHLVSITR